MQPPTANGAVPDPAAMQGRLRRKIVLRAHPHRAFAALEDDYHRMDVRLEHDGQRVTGIAAHMSRHPLTICPEAEAPLQAFVGTMLSTRPVREIEIVDPRWQCTHLYDLAVLLLAQAKRGGERRYDMEVLDPCNHRVDAVLERDGQRCLHWLVQGTVITAPQRFAGQDTRHITAWALQNASDDELEAIRVLRRGLLIARGRANPRPTQPHPGMPRSAKALAGACHSFQSVNVVRAQEIFGSRQDFTDRPQDLLRDLPSSTPEALIP